MEEFTERLEFGWRGQHRPEAASLHHGPREQRYANHQQKWRSDALKKLDGPDSAHDYYHVQQPEAGETDPHARGIIVPRGNQRHDHRVDRFAANPRLDAEPSARHKRSQNRRNVRSEHSERRASEP